MDKKIIEKSKIAIFRQRGIRKTIHKNEWLFVINDVIVALTDSANPNRYLKNMRRRDKPFGELFTEGEAQIEPPLALEFQTAGGKQKLLCWNTEAIFRLVQSIPSSKAEPFKRWLAKVGYERIQEIVNPRLTIFLLSFTFTLSFPRKWESRPQYAQDILHLHISK